MDAVHSRGDLGPALLVFVSVAIVVTTIAIFLRLYVRIFLIRRVALDDYLIIVCQCAFLASMYCVIREIKFGLGKHFIDLVLTPEEIPETLKYYFFTNILIYISLSTVKLAIISFFLYLCPPRPLRITAIAVAIFTVFVGLGAMMFHAFHCYPSSYYWEKFTSGKHGYCIDPHTNYIFEQLFNALDMSSDFILAALPIIMVWNMKMSRSHKFGVSILLGSGVLSTICPFARAFYLRALLVDPLDTTYHAAPVVLLTSAECAIALTVVCIAQLRPLYRKLRGTWSTIDESAKVYPTYERSRTTARRNVAELNEIQMDVRIPSETYPSKGGRPHVDKDGIVSRDLSPV